MKALTTSQNRLLLRILAETDALWMPERRSLDETAADCAAIAAIHERRSAFHRDGIPLFSGGSNSDRQSNFKEVSALVSRGLVRRAGRGKSRGLLLTRAGDDYTRSMSPSRRVDEVWSCLQRVAKRQRGNRFVRETDIVRVKGDTRLTGNDPLSVFTYDCLSLLANDLLEAASDTVGALGYLVTPAGKAALASPPAAPETIPPYNEELASEFTDMYCAALKGRDTWEPKNRNLVVIPLSAGMW